MTLIQNSADLGFDAKPNTGDLPTFDFHRARKPAPPLGKFLRAKYVNDSLTRLPGFEQHTNINITQIEKRIKHLERLIVITLIVSTLSVVLALQF